MSPSDRIVITGMGVVSPAGYGVPALEALLRSGECRVAPITRFDASAYRSEAAAEVPDLVADSAVTAARTAGLRLTPRYGRAALYGLAAVAEADLFRATLARA